MEAAMKMARQYYMELNPKQPKRINFIGREGSYHGSTLGSLSMGGHVARRKLFEGMLLDNVHRVSAANEYRGKADGQTTEEYVQQLADELDRKFQELGPDTVAAFVCESLVGAVSIHSSGCSYLWLTLFHKRPLAQSLRLLAISKL
jgi:adenosylmethionine-8-amino-7-oxononanoate aminotransferase